MSAGDGFVVIHWAKRDKELNSVTRFDTKDEAVITFHNILFDLHNWCGDFIGHPEEDVVLMERSDWKGVVDNE